MSVGHNFETFVCRQIAAGELGVRRVRVDGREDSKGGRGLAQAQSVKGRTGRIGSIVNRLTELPNYV